MLNVYGAYSDCYKTRADCYETCTDCYEVRSDCYETCTDCYKTRADCYETRTDCYKVRADCYKTRADCYEVNNDSYEAHANHNRGSAILMQLAPTIAALLPIIADKRQTIFVLITSKRKVNHFKCEKRPKK